MEVKRLTATPLNTIVLHQDFQIIRRPWGHIHAKDDKWTYNLGEKTLLWIGEEAAVDLNILYDSVSG